MTVTDQPVRYLMPGLSNWRDVADAKVGEERQADASERLSSHLLSSLQMQNLLVLTGLGTSLEVGGPTMGTLWDLCVGSTPDERVTKVLQTLRYTGDEKNIEELLSRCDALLQGSGDVDGVGKFKNECITKILDSCRNIATGGDALSHHKEFIRRLARRRVRDPRLRLFTTNYDQCFERAAGELGLTTIDGFSFSNPRRFDPRYFEYDVVRRSSASGEGPAYVPGVFQYFKLHGSVDWELDENGNVIINSNTDPARACLIYPTRKKFQFSFQQPHLELMAQFLTALRQPNTCLLVVGIGFNDAHLTEPIVSALDTNPHLRLLIVSPNADRHYVSNNPIWNRLKRAFERGDDIGFIKAKFSALVPLIPDLRVLTPGERLERDIRQMASKP
jgi:hypothetical protein